MENCPIKIDVEVVNFIAQKNLGYQFFQILSNLIRIFPNLNSIEIRTDQFEDAEEEHIVTNIVSSSDQKTLLNEYHDFVSWEVENIGPEDLGYFILTMDRI